MEESNNYLIKVLAIILIAILGINVYRTETTKKEITELSIAVNQIQSKIDSLELTAVSTSTSPNANNKRIATLERKVSGLASQVTDIKNTVHKLSNPIPKTTTAAITPISTTSNKDGKVYVTAKVKVENRYVNGTTYLPKMSSGPEGIVVINVTMDRVGIVGAVSVNPATTIRDEDILDLCKESALKTSFAYNPDAPQKSSGTITYTFTAK